MQSLTFDCEIGQSRDVVLRLPASVNPGRHRIALVIDPAEQSEMLAHPTTGLDKLFDWIDAQTPPPTIPLSAMDRDAIYCLVKSEGAMN